MANDFKDKAGLRFVHSHSGAMQDQIFHGRILDLMVEALLLINADMTISYANQAFYDLFGYKEQEIIGKPIHKLGIDDTFANLSPVEIAKILREQKYWQGEVLRRSRDGNYLPVLVSARAVFDDDGELEGFIGTYTDLRRLYNTERRLKDSLTDTIIALAKSIEDRDLYKSNHHHRVVDLCVAIALDMGKDTSFIEGLSMAAVLHDIGKIYIPSEVLNYSGALTEAEMRLVKTHPTVGYQILKGIDMPWPVAEMVLQHHERLDGSGYPNKLRKPDILIGAKILAVADVVETMFSDRPHRPGYPLEACLDEIERHRGSLYENDVVDACVGILREGRYTLAKR